MPYPARRRARLSAVAVTTLVLVPLAAGCSDPGEPDDPAAADADAVRVESCGRTLAFDGPPERAVTLDQSSTETLLELGLADRMVGTSNLKTEVAPEYQDAYDQVPVLSPEIPTGEQVREATPDVVVASFTDNFSRDRVGTRAELAELGVPSYVSAVDCPEHGDPEVTAFDRLFTDYENYGRIFGVEDRAGVLVDEQRQVIDEAAAAAEAMEGRPTVVWLYSVYNGLPYVAGGTGLPSEMSELIGAENAFDDVNEDWPEVSWEEIADRDPDVIVIGDLSERGAPGDSAEEKLQMLRDDPVTSQLTAVWEEHIIEVPGIEMDPSVRSVNTLGLVVDGMRDLGYVG
ncbi:ABC transporter substrate-binding protein [Streptomyces litchfieldiae]|uniref:ABC transporter substrate-binding protein n=1 Tax=Streptomyces litchfieldiae TaxID=3075543 RepID=A0ABU2MVR5_9ACTN|nr:ABC transporter substrate-binding protein [Streptomyces sp. DSM 44938]MDT0345727.1 ABC transporter substrate-binding protein [Streptomyces sp. DSM 44938]